jgi:hypothetical protein
LRKDYHIEVIPLQGGIIDYYYLSESNNLEYDHYFTLTFGFVKTQDIAISHDLLLVMEAYEYQSFPRWFPLFAGYGKILIISIERMEIAYQVAEIT